MRAVVQRVREARVRVDDAVVGETGGGFLVLVGVGTGDTADDASALARKVCGLRVFDDPEGKMNLALADIGGTVLAVSQFTLWGDCRKGRRPSFIDAARPEVAKPLFDRFVECVRAEGITCGTGIFGADMHVELVNDGPVTLLLDTSGIF